MTRIQEGYKSSMSSQHVTRGTIQIHKVASEVNTADIFTKGLVAVKFCALRLLLIGW